MESGNIFSFTTHYSKYSSTTYTLSDGTRRQVCVKWRRDEARVTKYILEEASEGHGTHAMIALRSDRGYR